jgi:uncharacterized RDD family membrane protein YckC
MKKITELTEIRMRTVESKDATGKRVRTRKEYIASRPVKSIASGPRFGHFIIDGIVFQIVLYVVQYLFELLLSWTRFNISMSLTIGLVYALIILLLYPLFYALCEFKFQRTPGKYLTRTIVIDIYGNKPDLRTITLRSMVRIVPFEAFSCLGEDSGSRGWHDRWSETWVVKEDELKELKKLQAEQTEINNPVL